MFIILQIFFATRAVLKTGECLTIILPLFTEIEKNSYVRDFLLFTTVSVRSPPFLFPSQQSGLDTQKFPKANRTTFPEFQEKYDNRTRKTQIFENV